MIDNLTDWLLKLVQPLVVRVMTALGLSVVTIEGTQSAFDQTLAYVQSAVNSMPAAVLQMGEMFGVSTGMSWVFGAISFAFSLFAIRKFLSFFALTGTTS